MDAEEARMVVNRVAINGGRRAWEAIVVVLVMKEKLNKSCHHCKLRSLCPCLLL
jgi:hypothetical protein